MRVSKEKPEQAGVQGDAAEETVGASPRMKNGVDPKAGSAPKEEESGLIQTATAVWDHPITVGDVVIGAGAAAVTLGIYDLVARSLEWPRPGFFADKDATAAAPAKAKK